jgi:hypothetical protein
MVYPEGDRANRCPKTWKPTLIIAENCLFSTQYFTIMGIKRPLKKCMGSGQDRGCSIHYIQCRHDLTPVLGNFSTGQKVANEDILI